MINLFTGPSHWHHLANQMKAQLAVGYHQVNGLVAQQAFRLVTMGETQGGLNDSKDDPLSVPARTIEEPPLSVMQRPLIHLRGVHCDMALWHATSQLASVWWQIARSGSVMSAGELILIAWFSVSDLLVVAICAAVIGSPKQETHSWRMSAVINPVGSSERLSPLSPPCRGHTHSNH